VEPNELAKTILEQDGWDKLDLHKEDKNKLFQQKKMKERANVIFNTFNTDNGKQALEELVTMFLMKPIANPNDDMLAVGIREGQARIVKWLLQQIEIAKKG
jgi:hypothetical protein